MMKTDRRYSKRIFESKAIASANAKLEDEDTMTIFADCDDELIYERITAQDFVKDNNTFDFDKWVEMIDNLFDGTAPWYIAISSFIAIHINIEGEMHQHNLLALASTEKFACHFQACEVFRREDEVLIGNQWNALFIPDEKNLMLDLIRPCREHVILKG